MSSSILFHDNWHKLSNRGFELPPYLNHHIQYWHKECWHVISDPYSNRFWRLKPQAWQFLLKLKKSKPLEKVWYESLKSCPEDTPGQGEVVTLLSQLSTEGLILSDRERDFSTVSKNYKREKARALQGRILNFLFIPVPLWDPDLFLRRNLSLIKWIFSTPGLILFTLSLFLGTISVLGSWGQYAEEFEGVLSLDNLIWLYLCWALVKFFHELGHAMSCRVFGGEVHTMGVMFLVFMPLPYVDASSSWKIQERWKRVMVGSSGILFELTLSGLAALIWANSSGTIHHLAYNVMLIASISTFIFNINPLLRLDGYYILSDFLDIPNMHHRASESIKRLLKDLFSFKGQTLEHDSCKKGWFLPLYAILSTIYRGLVFFTIALFLSDTFEELGVLMAALGIFLWVIVPVARFSGVLFSDLIQNHATGRVLTILGVGFLFSYLLLVKVKVPYNFSAPGVIRCSLEETLAVGSSGKVIHVLAHSGDRVKKGDVLLLMESEELKLSLEALSLKKKELNARLRSLNLKDAGFRETLASALQTLKLRERKLLEERERLNVRAPEDGILWLPHSNDLQGRNLTRGIAVGKIFSGDEYKFQAIVSQRNSSRISELQGEGCILVIEGHPFEKMQGSIEEILPFGRSYLPSSTLGIAGGGGLEVDLDSSDGKSLKEPAFQVMVKINSIPFSSLFHNQRGRVRFSQGKMSLAGQFYLWWNRAFSKRFKEL